LFFPSVYNSFLLIVWTRKKQDRTRNDCRREKVREVPIMDNGGLHMCGLRGVPIRSVEHTKGFPIVKGRSRKTIGQTIENGLN
jgi:hypothetical protein